MLDIVVAFFRADMFPAKVAAWGPGSCGMCPFAKDPEAGEDFALKVKRKVLRVQKFLADPVRRRLAVLLPFIVEPLDWAWQRVQHLDEQGKVLLDLASDLRNPFRVTENKLSAMVLEPLAHTTLAPVCNHFAHEASPDDQRTIVTEIRTLVLGLLAQVHVRFTVEFSSWPYRLAQLVDVTASAEEREELAREFFRAEDCCLDPHCSRKLRNLVDSPEQLLADMDLMNVLRSWTHVARVSNMHTERTFARIRKSVPHRLPNAERLCAAGYLAQVRHKHRCAGGEADNLVRQDLVGDGAPVSAFSEQAKSMPSKARGHVMLMTKRIREAQAAKGGRLTREELRQTRAAACAEYAQMPPGVQEELRAQARVDAEAGAAERDKPMPEQPSHFDGGALWNVGSLKSPLDPSIASELLRNELGIEEVTPYALDFGVFGGRYRVELRKHRCALPRLLCFARSHSSACPPLAYCVACGL